MAVYFIQDEGGEIKIGYTGRNPHHRLNDFKTGNPRALTLLVSIPGGQAEEQALHDRFADLRGNGEWFKPDARLLGFVEGMKYAFRDQQPKDDGAAGGESLTLGQVRMADGYSRMSLIRDRGVAALEKITADCWGICGTEPEIEIVYLYDHIGELKTVLGLMEHAFESIASYPDAAAWIGAKMYVDNSDILEVHKALKYVVGIGLETEAGDEHADDGERH